MKSSFVSTLILGIFAVMTVGTFASSGPMVSPDQVISFVGGRQVKLTPAGHLFTSEDGNSWKRPVVGGDTFFRNATFGNGICVVVGGSYMSPPGIIVTSRDGKNFARREIPSKSILYGVTFGNGVFVAVGDHGIIVTSTDTRHWTVRARTDCLLLSAVAFGDGKFIAVGDSGTILSSSNGIAWQKTRPVTAAYLSKSVYYEGTFVAAAGMHPFTSTNGVNWIVSVMDSPIRSSSSATNESAF